MATMTRTSPETSTHQDPGTAWSPPAHAPFALMPAGVWWDAVRVPYGQGRAAIQRLGRACGGVIGDPYRAGLYWLIPPGSREFAAAPGVVRLSVACWLAVPARDRTVPPGPYWAVPYERGRVLTAPGRLRVALADEGRAR
jgi:hypothetical protein